MANTKLNPFKTEFIPTSTKANLSTIQICSKPEDVFIQVWKQGQLQVSYMYEGVNERILWKVI